MSYVAARSMKVQKNDGSYEIRQPGDPVPEAESWANPDAWVKRGFIRFVGNGSGMSGIDRSKYRPPRAATKDDYAKRAARKAAKLKGLAVVDAEDGAEIYSASDLNGMKKAELLQIAEKRGLGLTHHKSKDDVVSAILQAQDAGDSAGAGE